jgi:hypothetical protein
MQTRDIRETVSRLVLGQLVDVTERPVSERVVIALSATGEEDALTDVSRSSARDDVFGEHGGLLVLCLVLLEELVQVSDVLRSEDVSACDVVTDEVRHGLSITGSSDNGKGSVLRGDVLVGASRVGFLHQAHLTLRFTLVGERVRPLAAVTVGLNNGELHDVSVLSYQSRRLEGCKSQRKCKAKTEGFYRRLPLCFIVAKHVIDATLHVRTHDGVSLFHARLNPGSWIQAVRAISFYGRGIGLGKAHEFIVAWLCRIRQSCQSNFHPSFRIAVIMVPLANESVPDLIQDRIVFSEQFPTVIYFTPAAYFFLDS